MSSIPPNPNGNGHVAEAPGVTGPTLTPAEIGRIISLADDIKAQLADQGIPMSLFGEAEAYKAQIRGLGLDPTMFVLQARQASGLQEQPSATSAMPQQQPPQQQYATAPIQAEATRLPTEQTRPPLTDQKPQPYNPSMDGNRRERQKPTDLISVELEAGDTVGITYNSAEIDLIAIPGIAGALRFRSQERAVNLSTEAGKQSQQDYLGGHNLFVANGAHMHSDKLPVKIPADQTLAEFFRDNVAVGVVNLQVLTDGPDAGEGKFFVEQIRTGDVNIPPEPQASYIFAQQPANGPGPRIRFYSSIDKLAADTRITPDPSVQRTIVRVAFAGSELSLHIPPETKRILGSDPTSIEIITTGSNRPVSSDTMVERDIYGIAATLKAREQQVIAAWKPPGTPETTTTTNTATAPPARGGIRGRMIGRDRAATAPAANGDVWESMPYYPMPHTEQTAIEPQATT